jgi:hypothetical protein
MVLLFSRKFGEFGLSTMIWGDSRTNENCKQSMQNKKLSYDSTFD